MRWLSRVVTLLVISAVVVVAALYLRSRMPNAQLGGQFLTHAMFHDASRLQVGSPVVIAGVRVGDITRLAIEGRYARVDMRLRENINLPTGTFATRKSDSLFGDSYIELIPAGTEPVTLLRNGEPIQHVQEGGSTDDTLRAIARAVPNFDAALDNVQRVMRNGRRWINGSVIEALDGADRWLAGANLERPLANADRALERFEDRTTAAADVVAAAVPQVTKRLADADRAIANARTQIKDAKAGITSGLADARTGFDRADQTIGDMQEVLSAVDGGRGDDWKGTLGRLVNDPGLANQLEDFSGDVAEGAAGLNRFRSWIGGRAEISLRSGATRVYATAELHTRTDKFYLIEFSYSGLGGAPTSELVDATTTGSFTRSQQIQDEFRLTAQFGKRYDFVRVRGGLKDSTPGIGADALFFNGRLRLSSDLYGSFARTPRLKVAGALAVFRSVYIMAGVDDALNAPGELPVIGGNPGHDGVFGSVKYGRDYFLGASLHFTDAELATILRFYGAMIAGAALAR